MNKPKNQFVGTGYTKNRTELAHSEKLAKVIHCFYNNKFFPCSFTTNTERKMEYHYKKIHYLKEVVRG